MRILRLIALFTVLMTPGLIALAMPNPQYVPLMNTAEFGKFVSTNMTPIIETSTELAKKAIPNSHYFLITQKISMTPFDTQVEQGKKPFATLTMTDGPLSCDRDVMMSVKTNEWGEGRQLTFTLADGIRCATH